MTTYTISALSEATGLSLHTLRFYEKEGLLRYVERTTSGRRIYGEASLGSLMGVITLKQAGLTLPQIKEMFDGIRDLSENCRDVASVEGCYALILEAKARLEKQAEEISRGLQLLKFFVEGGKKALQAAREGKNATDVFPFMTKEGILNMQFSRDAGGKLEASIPEEN